VIFWAVGGGLGASLLLPAIQSLIHGNFTHELTLSSPPVGEPARIAELRRIIP
jgi:hypothetical protein